MSNLSPIQTGTALVPAVRSIEAGEVESRPGHHTVLKYEYRCTEYEYEYEQEHEYRCHTNQASPATGDLLESRQMRFLTWWYMGDSVGKSKRNQS